MRTEQEFNAATEQYLNMVYRIALNWFGCVHDAEDAAQEVIFAAMEGGIRTNRGNASAILVGPGNIERLQGSLPTVMAFPLCFSGRCTRNICVGIPVSGSTGGDHASSEEVPHSAVSLPL